MPPPGAVRRRRSLERAGETARRQLGALAASFNDAILVEDEARRIVQANRAFVELLELECRPEDLVGLRLCDLAGRLPRRAGDPTTGPGPERLTRLFEERRPVFGERIALPDGRVLARDCSPVLSGDAYEGRVFVFRDVSSEAEAEAEWQHLLAAQREENRRLVELDRLKSDFLAEISHELRTPLSSILSFTDLLSGGVGTEDPDAQREYIEVIARNAGRLLRLVDDLLLLDRIETGSLPVMWGTFDIPHVVGSAVSSFSPIADRKGISLESEVGEGPPLCGDSQKVGQLLDVVISNALKFTPEHGRVVVTAAPLEDRWVVEVTDTGIGVPPSERPCPFDRFYRASNARAARLPGSGLGLSIARAIADLHGGTIALEPSHGHGGSVVRIELPLGRVRRPT